MVRTICLTLTIVSLKWVHGIQPELEDLFPWTRNTTKKLVDTYEIQESPVSHVPTTTEYTSPQPKLKVQLYALSNRPALRSAVLQYAPLIPQQQKTLAFAKVPSKVRDNNLEKAYNRKNKNHLEPRFENIELIEAHKNHYRSFVPGYNVEVLPRQNAGVLNALYQEYYDYIQTQKVNVPRYNNNIINPSKRKFESLHFDVEDDPTSGTIQNTNQKHRIPGHKITSHAEPDEQFSQQLRPKVPRLHLNIARVYGISHLPHKAPESQKLKENKIRSPPHVLVNQQSKPTSYDKTRLFPVDFMKYFSVR